MEKDRDEVFSGQFWATSGEWVRRCIAEALALEVRASWDFDDEAEGLRHSPDVEL